MRRTLAVTALWAAACSTDEPPGADDTPVAWDQPGPSPLGALTVMADAPDDRQLPTEVWFPTETQDGLPWEYVIGWTGRAQAQAAPSCDTPRPVVLFSHGNTGVRYQSVFVGEHLASHGWIVIAPDHVGNTVLDTDDSQIGRIAVRRPADLAAAYQAVLDHPELGPCIDPDDGVAVMGHSFGGWTSLAAGGATLDPASLDAYCGDRRSWLCQIRDEIDDVGRTDLALDGVRAIVPMAPSGFYPFGDDGISDLGVPALVLGGDMDAITPWETDQQPIFDAMTQTPRAAAKIAGASHYTFSDACTIAPIDTFCRGDIDLAAAHRLINGMTTRFLHAVWHDEPIEGDYLPPQDDRVTWQVVR